MSYGVIHRTPVVFVHIPKVGGTSIKKYFNLPCQGHATISDFMAALNKGIIYTSVNEKNGATVDKLLTGKNKIEGSAANVFEHSRQTKTHPLKNIFKFSFVRNPWDRLASIYHYHKLDYGGLGNFSDLISDLKNKKGPIFSISAQTYLRLTQSQYLSIGENVKSVFSTNRAECTKTPHIAYRFPISTPNARSVNVMNYIGRYERLADDVKRLNELLGRAHGVKDIVETDFTIHERRSENNYSSYKDLYKDTEMIFAVYKYYYDDVTKFGYTFSGEPQCDITDECARRMEANFAAQSL